MTSRPGRIAAWLLLTALCCAAAALFMVGTWSTVEGLPDDLTHGDRRGYQIIAMYEVFSRPMWIETRPPAYPIFLRFHDVETESNRLHHVIESQILLCWGAWILLALVLAREMQSLPGKALIFSLMLGLAATEDVFGWTRVIQTESFSISTMVLLVAALVLLWREVHTPPTGRAWWVVLLAGFTTATWSMTRDANSYMVPCLALGAVALALWRRWRGLPGGKALAAYAAICVLTFGFQSWSSGVGLRWRMALVNVISFRVLPDPEATAYFVERGMPDTMILDCLRESGSIICGAWTEDRDFPPWLDAHGRPTYMGWLLSRPVETVLEPIRHFRDTLTGHSCEVTDARRPHWQFVLEELLYPAERRLAVLWILALGGCLLPGVASRRGLWLPLALLVLVYPHMFINFWGDSFEYARHRVGAGVQMRLALWWLIALHVDHLWARLTARRAPSPP